MTTTLKRANMRFTYPGKASFVIDGQFGSTGKGLIAGYLASQHHNECDIATTNASANAGHTTIIGDKKAVTFHMPTFAYVQGCMAYLNAGAIINPKLLQEEIETLGMDRSKIVIHPRAAVITDDCVNAEGELNSAQTKLASTRKGVGQALARKVLRSGTLAGDVPELKEMIGVIDLNKRMGMGAKVVCEIPQGFSLGVNSGLAYPYCTSRDVTVMQGMADALIHPSFLGEVMMSLRTFPIRVGNIVNKETGIREGWSGPHYFDQEEVSFEDLGVEPELTTVTKRVRRIFTFSLEQYRQADAANRPSQVFLNFCNYLKTPAALEALVQSMGKVGLSPTHYGIGPANHHVYGAHEYDRVLDFILTQATMKAEAKKAG